MNLSNHASRTGTVASYLAVAAGIIALTGAHVRTAHAETVDIPVNKAVLVTAFNGALSGFRVKVHNLGSRKGDSWLSDKSYVLLPTGQRRSFKVPEQSFRFPKTNRHLKHYVKDFNSSSFKAHVDGSQLIFVAEFESEGEEVKGKCVRRGGPAWKRKWVECSFGIERDVHLNNSRVEIVVKPVAYNGSISYSVQKTKFKTDVSISNRLCKAAKGICGRIESWLDAKLTKAIVASMKASLSDRTVRSKVASVLRRSIPGIDPSWRVTRVTSSGNRFLVRVERPDQIDGRSVRSLALSKPSTRPQRCPAALRMSATINTKYAMKGTAYLQYENGKKSKAMKWQTNKPGKVTSKLVRNFKGKAGKNYPNLRTKLVATWKGIDGKTYKKSSNTVRHGLKCTKPKPGLTLGR